MKFYQIAIILISLIVLNGCVSYDGLVNYKKNSQNTGKTIIIQPDIRIQAGDVLSIKVFSKDSKTAEPFNLVPTNERENFQIIETIQLSGYLVDKQGIIDFPGLGKVSLKGLTTTEAKEKILKKLDFFLRDPVVDVRLLNFRVTISGEVRTPRSFTVINERITLPEALTLAGDLTDYADRSNILIVREENGVRTLSRVNLLSSDLFQSDYYYLKQNDLVYVEPVRAKIGAIRDQSNETASFITAAASLVTILVVLLQL